MKLATAVILSFAVLAIVKAEEDKEHETMKMTKPAEMVRLDHPDQLAPEAMPAPPKADRRGGKGKGEGAPPPPPPPPMGWGWGPPPPMHGGWGQPQPMIIPIPIPIRSYGHGGYGGGGYGGGMGGGGYGGSGY